MAMEESSHTTNKLQEAMEMMNFDEIQMQINSLNSDSGKN
eukprot:CAMPEP_0170566344 /NCGR_PEP_ID=MMETSP0211-20121228/79772_1 /TAXON_ID=311385 /ORGANISM="Pseudokeronopsis sp., Strain OXSARD2" /LENGTH=39 /DNA_ID= /DNA_START= /DNA_END= /DNA_ORIENTATION=